MNRSLHLLLSLLFLVVVPFTSWGQLNANFTISYSSACAPALVSFTDISTGNPTSWSWDLGNGNTSTSQNPSTTYLTAGTKTITLTVSNGTSTSTYSQTLVISNPPVVDFTASATTICAGSSVTFTPQVTLNAPGAASYLWDFGDGYSSTASNPSHTYATAGTYTVSLFVRNGAGCGNSVTKTQYITVASAPHADFTSTNNIICGIPSTVNFTSTSTGAVSYSWSFGDGSTSTAQNPSHSYTVAGTYDVKLVVTGVGGCKDSITKTGFVQAGAISASFNYGGPLCNDTYIPFINTTTSTGAFQSYWYFDGVGPVNSTNTSYSFAISGAHTVKLVVIAGGCKDSVTQTVNISARPVANFTSSTPTSCYVPFTVNFTSTSTGAVSYSWDFGDGSFSTAQNPSHTYTTPGTYNVSLNVQNSLTCTGFKQIANYVIISPPVSSITATPVSGCMPLTVAFSATSNPAISTYNWNFGDPSSGVANTSTGATPTHTFNDSGSYTVKLRYTTVTGCLDSITQVIRVDRKPHANFIASPTNVCINDTVKFINQTTDTTNNTTYTWSFGAGTSTDKNPSFKYNDTGRFTVRLIASNGTCRDTLIRTNYITVQGPKAKFVYDYTCANRLLYTFTNQSYNNNGQTTTYLWNFGDPASGANNTTTTTSPNHTFSAYGTFTIILVATGSGGCRDTMRQTINILPLNSNFSASATTVCVGTPVTFTVLPNTDPSLYKTWYWGDNTSITTFNSTQTKTYNTPGVYTVKLVTTDYKACQDSTVKLSYITVTGPHADFTGAPVSGCSPLTVNFTDNSTPAASISSRIWTFGDGNTLTGNNATPSHIYASGTFSVKLVVTDNNGCKDSLSRNSYISATKPTAAFTASTTSACKGQPIAFTNSSTGAASSEWDFGDNQTSSATNPSHVYNASGSFTVRLIVTNAGGCKDTLIRTAYIQIQNTQALFTMSDSVTSCPPLSVTFTNNSVNATSYAWTFGNGSASTNLNATTVYNQPGVYTVKLVVTSSIGCKDSLTKTVRVNGPTGTFSYTPLSGCKPLQVTFTANAINTVQYAWDMGNGVVQNTTVPTTTYTYTTPGRYVPVMILSDGANCSFGISGIDTIKVDSVHAAFIFAPASACINTAIQFSDRSVSASASITQWNWDFGDGQSATTQNPSHSYTTSGTKTVRLIAVSATGCRDTITQNVIIYPQPSLIVSPTQTSCAQNPVQLNASGADSYLWSPGATLSCTTCPDPIASPTVSTTYKVVGTTINGCKDSANVLVNVTSVPTITATATPGTLCAGSSSSLNGSGAGLNGLYTWSPATGLSSTTGATVTATPTTTTTYTVVGQGGNGCNGTATVTVTVNPLPTITTNGNQTICAGASAALTANGAGTGGTYTWSPATGLNTTTGATVTASPTATTTYTVTGRNSNNCQSTATVTVTVNPLPAVTAIANPTDICVGSSSTLTAGGTDTYTWSPATGLNTTTGATVTANPVTTTTYTVVGTNTTTQCTKSATVTLTVHPLPTITATAVSPSICLGGSTNITASGAGTGGTYTWSPATGLNTTTGATVVASPGTTTTYTITGRDAFGCESTRTITITVNPLPTITTNGNQTICAGASATLTATGAGTGGTYTWSPATGLNTTTGATVTASPTTTTTYTVTGRDANGCQNTTTVQVIVNQLPSITVTAAPTDICVGGNSQLTANGGGTGATYTWSPATGLNTTTGATVTASPTVTTTYTVTGTSGVQLCSNTATVTVVVHPLPTISVTPATSTICNGASTNITASGAGTGGTYTWSPATGLNTTTGATVTANPTATTTYTVTGRTSFSCTNTATATVTVNPIPTVTVDPVSTICRGASATLSAHGASTYTWSPATGLNTTTGSTVIASPLSTTTYTVTGTTAGCSGTATITVNLFTYNPVSITGTHPVCYGDSIHLTANSAGTGVSYSWSPSTGLNTTTGAGVTATPTTTTTYKVVATDANGCKDSTQATITVNPLPVMVVSATQNICRGQSATLTASGAGTGGSYTWSPATGLNTTSGASVIATPNDTIVYTVTGRTVNGCRDSATIRVNVRPLPVIDAGNPQTVCSGIPVQLQASGGISYVWSPATGLNNTQISNPVATPSVSTTYTVTGTDVNGCKNTDTVTVSVNQLPVINAGPDQTICVGSSAQLQASGAQTYIWSPADNLDNNTIPNPVATPSVTTNYTVAGTDNFGCTDSAHVKITVLQHIPTSISPDKNICLGESAQLVATGGISYIWSPVKGLNNSFIANPVANPDTTTTYTVIITENACFSDTLSVTVTVHPQPTINFVSNEIVIYAGSSVQLNPRTANATQFAWTPSAGLSCTNCESPIATPTENIRYTLTVSNEWNCTAKDDISVIVTCDNGIIFLPNTFTPNGDGVNDVFYPRSEAMKFNIKMFRIYNRWGEVVFEATNFTVNDITRGWDGTYKGQHLPPDTYIYMLSADCSNGGSIQLKGDINLIR